MSYSYQSLTTPKNTGSGVSDFFYFAPVSIFTLIASPTLTAPPGVPVPGEEVTITADHTFGVGDGFVKMLCAPFMNQFSATAVGDPGSKKLSPKFEVFMTGSYAELHEFAKNALNQPAIILSKDANCDANMYYQIGSSCVYAWLTDINWSSGQTRDGKKGYAFTWETAASSILLYKGGVTEKA